MAGIGFELRRLARADDLFSLVKAYAHASLVSSGPWLFTIVALAAINFLADSLAYKDEVILFRTIIIYNFSFSLTFSGAIVLVVTRYLADRIYLKNVSEAPGMMLCSVGLAFLTQMPACGLFYGWFADLTTAVRIAAVINYLLIAAIWVIALFVSALKDFRSITMSFGGGMVIGFGACALLADKYGTEGLLTGFSAGLAFILFALAARVFAEYPYRVLQPFAFLQYFKRYWELAAAGLAYNAAIWVDKWIMWFAPENEVTARVLYTYPAYDSAMFLAYLTIVPALAAFMINVETGFFEYYLRFYRDIQNHVPLRRIRENHDAMTQSLSAGLRNIIVLQATIAYLAILLAPVMFSALGIGFHQLGMFRFGVLGAMFHALFLFLSIIIAYFDLRRDLLKLYGLYLVSNAVLTWVSLNLGFSYYGYGYFLASLITALSAYALLTIRVRDLPYLTFIANNPSVQRLRD